MWGGPISQDWDLFLGGLKELSSTEAQEVLATVRGRGPEKRFPDQWGGKDGRLEKSGSV